MKREDSRHIINTSANKNLNIEMDLWVRFIENNKEKVLIGRAVSNGRYNDSVYELYYAPCDITKDRPYLLTYKKGSESDSSRFENIPQAKYYLKKSDCQAKWKGALK
jgi:hypothetical protein